jgi:hypothetical protein
MIDASIIIKVIGYRRHDMPTCSRHVTVHFSEPHRVPKTEARDMVEAAVAAPSLASCILSLVGLDGQILQGCHYVSNLFGDVHDAPDPAATWELNSRLSALCFTIFKGRLRAWDSLLASMLPQNKCLWHSDPAAPQSEI